MSVKEKDRVKSKGIDIERIRDILVGGRRGTNREGTFPPEVILDKVYKKILQGLHEKGLHEKGLHEKCLHEKCLQKKGLHEKGLQKGST